jgi:hypothetical protein
MECQQSSKVFPLVHIFFLPSSKKKKKKKKKKRKEEEEEEERKKGGYMCMDSASCKERRISVMNKKRTRWM